MSTNVSRRDKRSFDYIFRSGLAGGVAGCVVSSTLLFSSLFLRLKTSYIIRPRQLSLHLIALKFCSKLPTPTFKNTQVSPTISIIRGVEKVILLSGTWSGAFKVVATLYREGGVRTLMQGHSATLLRVFPYAATKFMAYDQIHHVRATKEYFSTNSLFIVHPGFNAY
jgi:solute carrier family 25 (mitochondrial carrier protein), member 16